MTACSILLNGCFFGTHQLTFNVAIFHIGLYSKDGVQVAYAARPLKDLANGFRHIKLSDCTLPCVATVFVHISVKKSKIIHKLVRHGTTKEESTSRNMRLLKEGLGDSMASEDAASKGAAKRSPVQEKAKAVADLAALELANELKKKQEAELLKKKKFF